jgi:hypothetical protein
MSSTLPLIIANVGTMPRQTGESSSTVFCTLERAAKPSSRGCCVTHGRQHDCLPTSQSFHSSRSDSGTDSTHGIGCHPGRSTVTPFTNVRNLRNPAPQLIPCPHSGAATGTLCLAQALARRFLSRAFSRREVVLVCPIPRRSGRSDRLAPCFFRISRDRQLALCQRLAIPLESPEALNLNAPTHLQLHRQHGCLLHVRSRHLRQ